MSEVSRCGAASPLVSNDCKASPNLVSERKDTPCLPKKPGKIVFKLENGETVSFWKLLINKQLRNNSDFKQKL
jgi:hypothetical protein